MTFSSVCSPCEYQASTDPRSADQQVVGDHPAHARGQKVLSKGKNLS